MGGKRTESCGRCAMSSVVDVSASDGADADRDPFRGARIEVGDRDLRVASPGAWLSGLRARLDEAAARLTYGRSG